MLYKKQYYPLLTEDSPQIQMLELLLAQSKQDNRKPSAHTERYVFIEYFGKVLEWFGPVESLLEQLEQVRLCKYFHGDISDEDVIYRLKSIKDGFLVRLNQSARGGYLVTTCSEGKLVNTTFRFKPETKIFMFENQKYDDIGSLITTNSEKYNWKHPVE